MLKGARLAQSTSDGRIWSINTSILEGLLVLAGRLSLLAPTGWLRVQRVAEETLVFYSYILSEHGGSEGAGSLSLISHKGFYWS